MDSSYVTEVRRLLQTLLRKGDAAGRKVYLVTSAGRGEGKSTTAALLAVVAAQIFRKRVILVDSDFRRGSQHRLLGIDHRPGFCDVLQGRVSLATAVRSTYYPNLFALPAGALHGRMAEAFDEDVFRNLLQQLREEYDLVIVDSAPVVPVVEPLLMAEHVDAILLVAMAGQTPVSIVRRMRQIIAPVAAKVVGVILNNATESLPYYYDYRYYGYAPTTRERTRLRRRPGETETPSPERSERARE